jgi:hypothetical protein
MWAFMSCDDLVPVAGSAAPILNNRKIEKIKKNK